jgi:hypothetical protein
MLLIGLAGPDQVMVYVPHITQERKISWFKENDPEGVAFGYEVIGDEDRP